MLHIYVPSSEDRVMSYFGFKKEELPKTLIADMRTDASMKKFLFEGKTHTAEDLIKLESDFFDGALTPTLKSEEDKPSNMKGPVKVITGKSFETNVLNSGKDVLLKFYAPWSRAAVACVMARLDPHPPCAGAGTARLWLPSGRSWASSSATSTRS
jgi:hypothetical protein